MLMSVLEIRKKTIHALQIIISLTKMKYNVFAGDLKLKPKGVSISAQSVLSYSIKSVSEIKFYNLIYAQTVN